MPPCAGHWTRFSLTARRAGSALTARTRSSIRPHLQDLTIDEGLVTRGTARLGQERTSVRSPPFN